MREIDRYNYEEFFLDYLEGNLSDSETKKLEHFLSDHPDLKKELDAMCLLELQEDKLELDKSSLKQIPFKLDFDEFCIAKLEGDLERIEDQAFIYYLNNNLIEKSQYQQFEKTRLKANLEVLYPDRDELKRKDRKIIPHWLLSGVRVAASILVLVSVLDVLISVKDDEQILDNHLALKDSVNKAIFETNTKNDVAKEFFASNSKLEEASNNLLIDMKDPQDKLTALSKSKLNKIEEPSVSNTIVNTLTENTKAEPKKISLPDIIKTTEIEALANVQIEEYKIETINKVPVSSGLANLGMAWKSSIPEKRNKSILYAVAKMGVEKLGEITGKKVQLEKQYDSETEKMRVKFNTKGIGFSTSIK
ncbi:hypothetical protein [Marinifilum sp.]|uniref:hypothetical protein n=1 Tax=Marinifilum sp. TaxID=2033137 RepID=UPI003BAC4BF6